MKPHDNAQFLTFATAVIRAVDIHQGVLRAFVASAGNDHRLGANEAPPAILSIYLGDQLAEVFEQIKKSGSATSAKKGGTLQVGVDTLPILSKDAGDRNRTSPFAFTGNKFEFRAVGSAFSIAGPLFLLNTIIADSLEFIANSLESATKGDPKKLNGALQKLLQEILTTHGRIIFDDNGYAEEWETEAQKRGLKNLKSTPEALPEVTAKTTVEVFKRQGVLTKRELESREELTYESYINTIRTESKLMLEIGRTQIYPAAIRYINELAQARASTAASGIKTNDGVLERIATLQKDLAKALEELEEQRGQFSGDPHKKALHARNNVLPAMQKVRNHADTLEELVADDHWPLPSYQELLFLR